MQIKRISLRHASKGDFGIVLGKCKNAMNYQYFSCSQFAKITYPTNTADCGPAWNSLDFGQTSAPLLQARDILLGGEFPDFFFKQSHGLQPHVSTSNAGVWPRPKVWLWLAGDALSCTEVWFSAVSTFGSLNLNHSIPIPSRFPCFSMIVLGF